MLPLHGLDMIVPAVSLPLFDRLEELAENNPGIADNRNVHLDILGDRRRIHVDMDYLRVRRKFVDFTGNTVVEPASDCDDQITVGERHVRRVGAVHAGHAHPERMRRRKSAEPHKRRGNRGVDCAPRIRGALFRLR